VSPVDFRWKKLSIADAWWNPPIGLCFEFNHTVNGALTLSSDKNPWAML
jgi:hypothetical protein